MEHCAAFVNAYGLQASQQPDTISLKESAFMALQFGC